MISTDQKHQLSRLYIYISTASIIVLSLYCWYKYNNHYIPNSGGNFSFVSLTIFLVLSVLILIFVTTFKTKNKKTFLSIYFILAASLIFSYNFIHPVIKADNNHNLLVAERLQEQGIVDFLKNYHKPNLYKIKKSPQLHDKFLKNTSKLPFNYNEYLTDIEKEPQNIILSDGSRDSKAIKIMTGNYSPLWFALVRLFEVFSGDSYFSNVIIPANITALFFLVSLYFFLGLFYKNDEHRNKLMILSIILFLPIFLIQAGQITNVMFLGIIVQWIIFFMLKNTDARINHKDLLTGFLYSIAVLTKFTSLTLLLPITLYYLIRFKTGAILKFTVFLISFSALPAFLYLTFNYDMILNILIGSTAEFAIAEKRISNAGIKGSLWILFYQPFYFGLPFIFLLITHLNKIKKHLTRPDVLISYSFILYFVVLFFMLWRSWISRHWFGFIALAMPILFYIYNYCGQKKKLLLSTAIFLLVSNLLLLIHDGFILGNFLENSLNVAFWN